LFFLRTERGREGEREKERKGEKGRGREGKKRGRMNEQYK
jgi:hypothetical protein